MTPYGLVALDGADEDGGTLYALLDEGRPVLSAAWPQPLHQYAAERGREVVRLPAWAGAVTDDVRTPRRRRPMTEMLQDLSPTASPRCKVDGCDGEPVSRLGPYAGLCDTHRGERKATRPAGRGRRLVAVEAAPVEDVEPVEAVDVEPLTLADAMRALTDTVALVRELERHIEEERGNLAVILDELRALALGGVV